MRFMRNFIRVGFKNVEAKTNNSNLPDRNIDLLMWLSGVYRYHESLASALPGSSSCPGSSRLVGCNYPLCDEPEMTFHRKKV